MHTSNDPGLDAIELVMNKLGVPISPTVRGPALPATSVAHADIEAALEGTGLGAASEEA